MATYPSIPTPDYPIEENRFFAKEFGVQFEFVKDESDKVIKMNVIGNEKVICRTKRVN